MRKYLLLLSLLVSAGSMHAQKKALTHSVYDEWQSLSRTQISTLGHFTAWEVNPQEGDGTLYIRNNTNKKQIALPRGYKAQITDNEQYAVALIKAPFADTRKAKIKKKKADDMPKDSIAIIRLSDFNVKKLARVEGYKLGLHANNFLAIALSKPLPEKKDTTKDKKADEKKPEAAKDKKSAKPKVSKDAANPMLVYNLATGDTLRIAHADAYEVSNNGQWLAYINKVDKNKSLMKVMNMQTRNEVAVLDTTAFIAAPEFSWNSDKLLFLASADTLKTGSKHCALYETDFKGKAKQLLSASYNIKPEWGITENASPYYSRDGKQIFVGIQPYVAPEDTTKYDFETAVPSIWRWDAPETPPMLKINAKTQAKQTVLCSLVGGKLVQLGNSMYDRVRLNNRYTGRYALSTDRTDRMVSTQWDYQGAQPLYRVDVQTGKRELITDSKFENAVISPDGQTVVWFDLEKSQWMSWNAKNQKTTDLTSRLKVRFDDEDDDHPMLAEPYTRALFTSNSRGVVVGDRFDLWYINLSNGKAANLTKGEGRRDSIQYRYVTLPKKDAPEGIDVKEDMWLSVFNYRTKENGYARTNLSGNFRPVVYGKNMYDGLAVAEKASVFAYQKGDFNHPMDLYQQENGEQKLSAINPQQKDYLWGTPELFQWNAYDGTKLDGLVYKPENFDPNKKYPVIIYFYERYSETLYRYYSPAPSRSIVNIPYFVSNDYIVFVPDIVYKDGHPGESAYNCICAGAEALAKNPWVDASKMAIQGQSWGGYQTAYLITRTNMFAAAGAGAPVSNMTSAFGGIRWESGSSRQAQYEMGQSRIGKDLWSGYDLYVENSPLFKLPNVTTPVLIMHNNADGAVPYYQGIEMFMGLRRLGKPAWLLEYDKEAHNLRLRKNCRDLSMRLSTFFDYYLKGTPMPDWMKPNTPYIINGEEIKR